MTPDLEKAQELCQMTPEQEKAFKAFKKAHAACVKAGIVFYSCLSNISGYNGANVKQFNAESAEWGIHPYDRDCLLIDDIYSQSFDLKTSDFADDPQSHTIELKEKARKQVFCGD